METLVRVVLRGKTVVYYYYFLRPLAQSRRLKIKQYGLIWLSLRLECARKRDCICLLDVNGKTLKEMNGLEWITRDSCCASANFLGQLNGLSIPRTRSFNDKQYCSGSDWSAIDVGVCISVRDSDIPMPTVCLWPMVDPSGRLPSKRKSPTGFLVAGTCALLMDFKRISLRWECRCSLSYKRVHGDLWHPPAYHRDIHEADTYWFLADDPLLHEWPHCWVSEIGAAWSQSPVWADTAASRPAWSMDDVAFSSREFCCFNMTTPSHAFWICLLSDTGSTSFAIADQARVDLVIAGSGEVLPNWAIAWHLGEWA